MEDFLGHDDSVSYSYDSSSGIEARVSTNKYNTFGARHLLLSYDGNEVKYYVSGSTPTVITGQNNGISGSIDFNLAPATSTTWYEYEYEYEYYALAGFSLGALYTGSFNDVRGVGVVF